MGTTNSAASGDTNDFTRTLAESGPFLRRLAMGLVRDVHAAEDAVQETLSRALAAGPAGVAKPHGWLAVILRNVVAGGKRRENAVGALPVDAAAPAPLETGPQAIALRLERERTLHRELRAVEEPYRTALVLRFGSELSVPEVATALGIGQSAAQSRITRGKALLRERLERRFDGERGWLGALAPLAVPRRAPLSLAASGASSAPPGMLIGLIACASILIAALWFASLNRDPAAGPALALAPESLGAGALLDPLAEVASGAVSRTQAEAALPARQDSPPPAPSLVFHGKGKDGAPLAGLPIFVARIEDQYLGPVHWAATGPDGVARFDHLAPGNYRFCSGRQEDLLRGYSPTIEAVGGGNAVRDLNMGQIAVPVRFDFDAGVGAQVTLWCLGSARGVGFFMPACTLEASEGLGTQVLLQRRFFATREGWLPSAMVSVDPRLPRRDDGTYLGRFGFERGGASVAGTVLRPNGSPAAGALVGFQIERSNLPMTLTVRTDGEGRFRTPCHLPFGKLRIETMLAGCGLLRSSVKHSAASEPLELHLPAERVLTGTVLDPTGQPMEYADVVATLSGERYPTSANFVEGALLPRPDARTSKTGRFRIAGLPNGEVTLFAQSHSSNASARVTIAAGDLPDEGLVLQLHSSVLLAGRAVKEDGNPLADLRLEVRQKGSYATGWTETAADGSFKIDASATDTWDRAKPLQLRAAAQYKLGDGHPALEHDLARRGGLSIGSSDLKLVFPAPPAADASIIGRIQVGPGSPPLDELRLHVQSTSVYEGIHHRAFEPETGRFNMGSIPPGTYDLMVTRKPHMTPVASRVGIELQAGQALDLGDILPGTGGHVEVTLIDDASGLILGEEAIGARALDLDAGVRSLDYLLRNEGDVWRTPWAVEPGRWTLRLRSKSYAADPVEVEVATDVLTTIKLRVQQR